MRLLAIDPGPVESAYVVMDGWRIVERQKISNELLLKGLVGDPAVYIDKVVIEMIACYGMPVGAEVFETCVWIGRFMQAFGAENCDRITRNVVKNHLCHRSQAKDANIRQALIDRLGPPGTKREPGGTYGISGDAWAALAVALTWLDKQGAPL